MDNNVNLNNQAGITEEYKPISMWGYFGYELLFSIPCIGLIVLIVLAVSAKNVNVKNFARSYFCFLIILGILAGIAVATGAGALIASSM